MSEEDKVRERIAEEEQIYEKTDNDGNVWIKVYFGGGSHLRNWLDQVIELCGEDNVEVEEIDSTGFKCYEEGGEKMHRIWVKRSSALDMSVRKCGGA